MERHIDRGPSTLAREETRRTRSGAPTWKARLGAPLMLALLCFGLRAVRLEADPPARYPNGTQARELYVEGPAKANEARRYAIYGTLETKPENNYRIWSVQSPVYVYPLAGALRALGASWASLRLFGALAAVAGILALYASSRSRGSQLATVATCLIAAQSYFAIQLTRGGLIEPYLNTVSTLAVLAAVAGQRRLVWILAAEVGFVAAVLTKQSALAMFPALAAAAIAAHLAARRRGEPWGMQAAVLGGALALAGLLSAYVLGPAYWRTVEWNFGHMVVGVEQQERVSMSAVGASQLVSRLLDAGRWRDAVLYITPLFPLAAAQCVAIAVDRIRKREIHPVDWISAIWLVGVLLSLQLTEHVRPRFSIVLLPPVAVLAGGLMARVARSPHLVVRWILPVAAACVVGLTDVRWHLGWVASPTYELRDAGRKLKKELERGDVLVGFRAPALAFDSGADIFYVKEHFNTKPETIRALGVTHLLADSKDQPVSTVKRALRVDLTDAKRLVTVRMRKSRSTLYRLPRDARASETR